MVILFVLIIHHFVWSARKHLTVSLVIIITKKIPCKHFFAVFNAKPEWGWNALPQSYLQSAYLACDMDTVTCFYEKIGEEISDVVSQPTEQVELMETEPSGNSEFTTDANTIIPQTLKWKKQAPPSVNPILWRTHMAHTFAYTQAPQCYNLLEHCLPYHKPFLALIPFII